MVGFWLIVAAIVNDCRGDIYLLDKGNRTWLEVRSLEGLPLTTGQRELLRIWRVSGDVTPGPDDPGPPKPDPPSDIQTRITSAVIATGDKKNAGDLRELYLIGTTLLDADAPTINVVTILKLGEDRILDTADERKLWAAYLSITARAYNNRPAVRAQDIRDIAAGIEGATFTNAPRRKLYFLLQKGER
jgi:hypothetical protein